MQYLKAGWGKNFQFEGIFFEIDTGPDEETVRLWLKNCGPYNLAWIGDVPSVQEAARLACLVVDKWKRIKK